MANNRRVVRKVENTGNHHFDEQRWPIQIALVVLGAALMGLSVSQLPLSGVAWYRTAWPSLIFIPIVIAAGSMALLYVESRLIRRSLQLSLVLCAILHVALIVQMLHTQLYSAVASQNPVKLEIAELRTPKIVPEYHPTQLVPEEDRPHQDFEKPVETESPQPTNEPLKIVREPSEQEHSPTEPQPVPTPEQKPTTEPNVVNRQVPNEVAPRLAAQTSRLSRQMQSSQSRVSQPVALPAAPRQLTEGAEARPSAAVVERQQSEAASSVRVTAEAATVAKANEAQLVRRSDDQAPADAKASPAAARREVNEITSPSTTQIAMAEQPASDSRRATVSPQPTETAVSRQRPSRPGNQNTATPETPTSSPSATAKSNLARVESSPKVQADPLPSTGTTQRRAIASNPTTVSSAAIDGKATPNAVAAANSAAQPTQLAINRAESGVAGSRRSQNLSTSPPGANSPALVASSAARRAESTQRDPTGDALAPSTTARMARSVAAADAPSATVKAEQLEVATAPGAAQIAEVSASSGAALTRADAAAPHNAITAAKGVGEIDFGPTQLVTEAGSGRSSGGGMPEIRLQSPQNDVARRPGGAPPSAIDARAAVDAAPPAATGSAPPSVTVAPAATVSRPVTEITASTLRQPSLEVGASPAESRAALPADSSKLARAIASETSPAITQVSARDGSGTASGSITQCVPAATAESGTTNVAEIPEVGPRSAVAQADLDHVASGTTRTAITRTRGDALVVDIAAPAGPGGLGVDFTPEVGINSRQARADSMNVELRSSRFLRSEVGGLPAVSTAAVIPAEAFSSRAARIQGNERGGGSGSNSPQTEEAIERGLAFLARYQAADGRWSLQGFPEGAELVSDTAATALAVLAFQGAGYNHREFQYRDVVRGGIAHLLKSQKDNGDLFVPLDDASNKSVWLYSHSLAAIAICEAYGMTQDPELREPAQKAIEFIIAGQQAERGGWRYSPGVGADTSVTGWMMMALKSGELAGLDVPPATYRKIVRWLDDAQQSKSEPHLYRYNPHAPDTAEQRHGRAASKTMTAVGLLMRLYTGWRRDNTNMTRGAAFLAENPPANGTARTPQRDTYYWYYATQVMAHMGGEAWQAWMARLHPLLINSQVRQGLLVGSWDPRGLIEDRWGPHAGRIYVTTMNLLSLEVQYRKLPLHEDVAR